MHDVSAEWSRHYASRSFALLSFLFSPLFSASLHHAVRRPWHRLRGSVSGFNVGNVLSVKGLILIHDPMMNGSSERPLVLDFYVQIGSPGAWSGTLRSVLMMTHTKLVEFYPDQTGFIIVG